MTDVDADLRLRAFQRQAAGEMDLGRLGRAIGGGVGRGGEPVLGGDEDDVAADLLALISRKASRDTRK